jgi:formylglycine-generating enzyme required for sulfatase activity
MMAFKRNLILAPVLFYLLSLATVPVLAADEARPLTAEAEKALKPGDSFRECPRCPEMVVVPAGRFIMGSPPDEEVSPHTYKKGEEPQREVTIAKPFAVGKFEVTADEYRACLEDGECLDWGKTLKWPEGRKPMRSLTWYMAKGYLLWLSKKTGKPYRLLSEAEWEYAARAGTTTPYYTGKTITPEQAWFSHPDEGLAGGPTEVGRFPPNPFGLYDMAGNVAEWTEDCAHNDYKGAPTDGSPWFETHDGSWYDCELRKARGGDWYDTHRYLRSAARGGVARSGSRHATVGFRVARTLEQ